MMYIITGILGFGLLFVSDICGLKKKHVLGFLSAFFGTFLIFMVSILILTLDYTYTLDWTYRIFGLIMGVLFLLLLIYSVVIEVSKNNKDKELVTSGTYALSRHPGVLWFFLYYTFGSLFFAHYLILIAGVLFTLVNILYVFAQEKYIFVHLFDNYEEYKQKTPMIIPNKSSLYQCLKTIDGGEHEKLTRNA